MVNLPGFDLRKADGRRDVVADWARSSVLERLSIVIIELNVVSTGIGRTLEPEERQKTGAHAHSTGSGAPAVGQPVDRPQRPFCIDFLVLVFSCSSSFDLVLFYKSHS